MNNFSIPFPPICISFIFNWILMVLNWIYIQFNSTVMQSHSIFLFKWNLIFTNHLFFQIDHLIITIVPLIENWHFAIFIDNWFLMTNARAIEKYYSWLKQVAHDFWLHATSCIWHAYMVSYIVSSIIFI
jgi:hypothetical protein